MPLRKSWQPKPCALLPLTLANWAASTTIVPEPEGGAHRDYEAAANLLDISLQKHLAELKRLPPADLLVSRYNKFRNIAQFFKTVA